MSVWRREAIRLLPELKSEAESARGPMALMIEVSMLVEKAAEANDLPLPQRAMDYVRCCLKSRDGDVFTAAIVGFAEDLAVKDSVRAILPEIITAQEYRELRPAMAYHAAEPVLAGLDRRFGLYNSGSINSRRS